MSDGFLHIYFLNNASKRMHKWIHYFDIYERHLSRFRGQSVVMLEIVVMGGGSLQMQKEFLGPDARIVGIDINPVCKAPIPTAVPTAAIPIGLIGIGGPNIAIA